VKFTINSTRNKLKVMVAILPVDGVMRTNHYWVDITSEAEAAECLAGVQRVCADSARP
jgi:hypothetical protein